MLIGIAVSLLVLIALLAIPVTLTYQVSWQEVAQGEVKLQWAFGLISFRIPVAQTKSASLKKSEGLKEKAREHKTSGNKRSPGKKSNPLPAIRQKSFRRRLIRFMRDSWHAMHKQNVRLRLRIGLGDPADTGQLWAIVGPMAGILASYRDASITIEPEFFDATFELDSSGNIRVIPLQMIYLMLGLLLSPSIWQGINQMRKVA